MPFWNLFWIIFISTVCIILIILVILYSIEYNKSTQIFSNYLYRQYVSKSFYIISIQLINNQYFIPIYNESFDKQINYFMKEQSKVFECLTISCRKYDIWKQMIDFIETKNDVNYYLSVFIIPDVIIYKNGNNYYNNILKQISQLLMKKTYFQHLNNQEAKEFLYGLFRKPILHIPK